MSSIIEERNEISQKICDLNNLFHKTMLKKHSTTVLNKDYTEDLAYIILTVTMFNMMLQSACKFISLITY